MKITVALFAAVSVLSAAVAFADPPKSASKPVTGKKAVKTAKVTDVWTCPITGEKIADHKTEAGTPQVVGNYRVHFCCAGCPQSFAKLSDSDKKEKALAAAKKDVAKTDSKSEAKGKS